MRYSVYKKNFFDYYVFGSIFRYIMQIFYCTDLLACENVTKTDKIFSPKGAKKIPIVLQHISLRVAYVGRWSDSAARAAHHVMLLRSAALRLHN